MGEVLSLQALRAKKGLPVPLPIKSRFSDMSKSIFPSYLATFKEDGKDVLVIAREAGAVLTLVFDENAAEAGDSDATLMLSSEHAASLVSRIGDELLLPNATDQYNEIWRYLASNKMTVRGPLLNARAAMFMRDQKVGVEQALDLAQRQTAEVMISRKCVSQELRDMGLLA